MKLRLVPDAVRLRLRRSDLTELLASGAVERSVQVGVLPADRLSYRLELHDGISTGELHPLSGGFCVRIPRPDAVVWSAGGEAGLCYCTPWGVRLLIEKDFACLEPRPGESDHDTFNRPAGTVAACMAES